MRKVRNAIIWRKNAASPSPNSASCWLASPVISLNANWTTTTNATTSSARLNTTANRIIWTSRFHVRPLVRFALSASFMAHPFGIPVVAL